jgi:pimeloyl-ACP methyl ester carboxylesterase
MRNILSLATSLLLTLAPFLPQPVRAAPAAQEIGIVVMHGKGGSPGRHVVALADALEKEGFLVANIEMPWSFKRHYDIELDAAVGEVTRALDAMRAKGAKKLFVSGHSQGGIFALLYGGRHKVDGVAVIGAWKSRSIFSTSFVLKPMFDDFTVMTSRRSAHPLQGRWLGAGAVRLLSGFVGPVRGLLREVVLRNPQHPHRQHPPVAEQHRRSGKPLPADFQDPGRAAGGYFRQGPPGHSCVPSTGAR